MVQRDSEQGRSMLEALAREKHPMGMFAMAKVLQDESHAIADNEPEISYEKVSESVALYRCYSLN